MRRIKTFLAAIALAFCLLAPAAPALAATDPFEEACKAKGSGTSSACQEDGSDPLTGKDGLLVRVTRIISWLAGVSSIILIVVAGLMYVMSDGDSSKVNSARTTLIYAVVGLIIVGVAQGIIVLVLNVL